MTHEEYVKAAAYWKNKEQTKMPEEELKQAVKKYISDVKVPAYVNKLYQIIYSIS